MAKSSAKRRTALFLSGRGGCLREKECKETGLLSLRRYTFRAMQQRPGRTILTMLSIVIGVTAAVAVGLGTATTRNAYKQMFAMVTGRAALEIDASGGGGFEDSVLEKVESVPEVIAAA